MQRPPLDPGRASIGDEYVAGRGIPNAGTEDYRHMRCPTCRRPTVAREDDSKVRTLGVLCDGGDRVGARERASFDHYQRAKQYRGTSHRHSSRSCRLTRLHRFVSAEALDEPMERL
jgi:hypothetical protein